MAADFSTYIPTLSPVIFWQAIRAVPIYWYSYTNNSWRLIGWLQRREDSITIKALT